MKGLRCESTIGRERLSVPSTSIRVTKTRGTRSVLVIRPKNRILGQLRYLNHLPLPLAFRPFTSPDPITFLSLSLSFLSSFFLSRSSAAFKFSDRVRRAPSRARGTWSQTRTRQSPLGCCWTSRLSTTRLWTGPRRGRSLWLGCLLGPAVSEGLGFEGREGRTDGREREQGLRTVRTNVGSGREGYGGSCTFT